MIALLTDLRTALKQMRHRPGLWTTMILTLALGLGANTAVFSVFQRLLLQPLPFPDGDRLVMVYNTYPKNDLEFAGTSVPDYLDRKTQVEAFEDIGIYTYDTLNVLHAGEASRVLSTRASASLFSTLGVQPVLGRTFTDDEAQKQQRLIVLGDAAWHRLFRRAPRRGPNPASRRHRIKRVWSGKGARHRTFSSPASARMRAAARLACAE